MVNWLETHNNVSFLVAILLAGFIFYSSSIPSSSFPSGLGILTKLYHLGIFFILTFFLLMALVQGKAQYKYFILTTLLIVIAYAITDELHQLFVLGRNTAIGDVLIDSIGIFCAGALYSLTIKEK
ncbi:MAG: VanZ family protein [Candidatus Pacearchaeota archaeon]|jgi:VanZ family protein